MFPFWKPLLIVLSIGVCDPYLHEESAPVVEIRTAEEIDTLDSNLESVTVKLRDRETLSALAAKLPDLKSLDLNYPPNGALPEGSVSELKNFKKLESLIFRGDLVIFPEELAIIGELVTLQKLKLALP